MTTYRIHLIYRDVFEEEADSLEEAEKRVLDCFNEAHDNLILGNDPEIFGYEYAGVSELSDTSRLARDLDKIEKSEEFVSLDEAKKILGAGDNP